MTTAEWIAKRRELLDAATEGPWHWEEPSGDDWPSYDESLLTETGEAVLRGWGYDASGIEGEPEDRALIVDARTSLPRTLDALEAVLKEAWRIESSHHFHGTTCTCGYASHRARDRTEHLTRPLTDAIESALRGES